METLAITVRPAEPRDAAGLARLHRLSWTQTYCGIIPHRSLRLMVQRRDQAWWRQAIARGNAILVLEAGGEAAGYATFGRNRSFAVPAEGEIYEIYLLPEYTGTGLGRRLFNAARARLRERGLRRVLVWALEDNQGATSFYEGQGGRRVAEQTESFEGRELRKIAFVWG